MQLVVDVILSTAEPRIAVLGTGGIGKTSLTQAVLHHPAIVEKYYQGTTGIPQISFIACERALSMQDMLGLVALHLNLGIQGGNVKLLILHELSRCARSIGGYLLVLDNLETCWEVGAERPAVEGFLAQLGDIEGLGLIVCY